MIQRYSIVTLVLGFLLLLEGCKPNEYALYDVNQKGSIFFNYKNDRGETTSSLSYRFNFDIAKEHIVELPINLMGVPREETRQIQFRLVPEKTDMVEGTHYTIEPAELAEGAISTTLRVKLLRDKDPALQQKEFRLTLELIEGKTLRPTGNKTFEIRYSDIRPSERPDWWTTFAPLPKYSFEAAQVFFDFFNRLAPKANKVVYDEMIDVYGAYFVKAQSRGGPTSNYRTFLIAQILKPMYDEHKDRFEWQNIPQL